MLDEDIDDHRDISASIVTSSSNSKPPGVNNIGVANKFELKK